jgi:hypothetical protein
MCGFLGFHEMTIFFAQDLRNFRAYFHIANLASFEIAHEAKEVFFAPFFLCKICGKPKVLRKT